MNRIRTRGGAEARDVGEQRLARVADDGVLLDALRPGGRGGAYPATKYSYPHIYYSFAQNRGPGRKCILLFWHAKKNIPKIQIFIRKIIKEDNIF